MKKIILILILSGMIFFFACTPDQPSAPKLNVTTSELALSKVVAIGNSLTAGFQSSGLVEDFQLNSYPYLLAQQMGKTEFEQPIIGDPGIGSPAGMTPMYLDENGNITQDPLEVNPLFLLKNALLSRPYDNLGVPGADLNDVLNTVDGSGGNPFFDIVLRNPNLGNTTQLEQAVLLQPTTLLLWIGNNDVLGAALAGGDLTQITSQADFQSRLTAILTQIRTTLTSTFILMANIPDVTDIPYVNTLDATFSTSPALGINVPIPVIHAGPPTFAPVPFDTAATLFLPLLTEESGVSHLTLPALLGYQQGLGIPDSAALRGLGFSAADARNLVLGMQASGLTPTGTPVPGDMTITVSEAIAISNAVSGFNQIIETLAPFPPAGFGYQIIDVNSVLAELNATGVGGLSGKYVLADPATTAFSLDGVHPNNAGHALVANEFIGTMNAVLSLSIPTLNVANYAGQYLGKRPAAKSLKSSLDGVRAIFRK